MKSRYTTDQPVNFILKTESWYKWISKKIGVKNIPQRDQLKLRKKSISLKFCLRQTVSPENFTYTSHPILFFRFWRGATTDAPRRRHGRRRDWLIGSADRSKCPHVNLFLACLSLPRLHLHEEPLITPCPVTLRTLRGCSAANRPNKIQKPPKSREAKSAPIKSDAWKIIWIKLFSSFSAHKSASRFEWASDKL